MGIRDIKKAGHIPNEIFPLVITITMDKFDVSINLIDAWSSCDIMYDKLFDIDLRNENILAYTGSNLKAFNDTMNRL